MSKHKKWVLLPEIKDLLDNCKSYAVPSGREQLLAMAMGGEGCGNFEVAYDVPGQGRVVEAEVVRCKNGASVNYTSEYKCPSGICLKGLLC